MQTYEEKKKMVLARDAETIIIDSFHRRSYC